MSDYIKCYLNNSNTRWINVNTLGEKDSVVLKTKKGVEVVRVCQYWISIATLTGSIEKCKISYKGKTFLVTRDTILED